MAMTRFIWILAAVIVFMIVHWFLSDLPILHLVSRVFCAVANVKLWCVWPHVRMAIRNFWYLRGFVDKAESDLRPLNQTREEQLQRLNAL